jgi:hypothetical protein
MGVNESGEYLELNGSGCRITDLASRLYKCTHTHMISISYLIAWYCTYVEVIGSLAHIRDALPCHPPCSPLCSVFIIAT